MGNVGYKAYLRSEHWQNLRLRKLASERGHCNVCHLAKPSMDVHHITYGPSLYRVVFRNLKTVCRDCHGLIHDTEELYKEELELIERPRARWHFILKKIALIQANERFVMEPDWELKLGPIVPFPSRALLRAAMTAHAMGVRVGNAAITPF